MNYLSIDTEFTSFYSIEERKSGELLQVSIIPVIDGVMDMDNAFNEYCRPLTKVWSKQAEEVHGISRKKAESFQHPEELAKKLSEWIKQYDDVFMCMGYNCTGDKRYIERLLYRYRLCQNWFLRVKTEWKDVKKMVKTRSQYIPRKSHTLSSICDYFKIEIDAHDAISDAKATYMAYEMLNQIASPSEGRQAYLDSKMTEIEKKRKYTDIKYFSLDGDGCVFITEHATKNKEALRVVLGQIWDLFVEEKE